MQDLNARPALTRRRALQSMAGGATAFLTRCGGSSAPRPNILLVMTDDQQHSQMSCAGHPLLQTPNMDRLAAEGARFANACCTNSLCAPGRATVLTGCYSHVHGIRGNSEKADAVEELDPSLPTFPQLLQQAGYRTGLVGKWHLRQQPRGFDEWRVLPGQGVYFDPDFVVNGEQGQESGYATDITTDFALDFLRRGGPEPFCLLYQHKAPHRPFTPAPRHADMFADIDWPKPPSYDDDYATRKVAAEARDMRFEVSLEGDYPDLPPDLSPAQKREWIYQRFAKDHHRAVFGVDEGLGRVLDYLDTAGLAEDTLVLYTTDNGYFIGEHGWYDKRFMYEPALRIPLLVRYPRMVGAAHVEDRPVLNIDIAPTLLDFAGLDVPGQMQGRSLRRLLEGSPPDDWRDSILYSYYENSWAFREMAREQMTDPSFQYWTAHRVGPHRGVRTDRYKLIEYYGEGDYWELFDLRDDPDELHNLYAEPGHAALVQELQAELVRLREHYGERG